MARVDPPGERECDRCGRQEVWDDDRGVWMAVGDDETRGRAHCVHEWDITGTYNPIARPESSGLSR